MVITISFLQGLAANSNRASLTAPGVYLVDYQLECKKTFDLGQIAILLK